MSISNFRRDGNLEVRGKDDVQNIREHTLNSY
jgi:hypothetical protein